MYNKLFTKILDSSIWLAPDPHRLVWITLIAAMDEDGNANFACVENLAARARVTVKQALSAMASFESPDPKSGDPENDGIRVERFPGGWHICNAHKYREMVTRSISREQTRLRVARFRANHSLKIDSNASVTQSNENVTTSEAVSEAVSEANRDRNARAPDGRADPVSRETFDSWKFTETRIQPIYPGGTYRANTWLHASRDIARLVEAGADQDDIAKLVELYAAQQRAMGNIGSQFVLSPAKFFGSDGHWRGPFPLPTAKPVRSVSAADKITWRPDPAEEIAAVERNSVVRGVVS